MSKKKVLVCSEASFLHSGFGTYAKELLTRLHATGKYELAEFASYGTVNDERDAYIKWKYYANFVGPDDQRMGQYQQFQLNQLLKEQISIANPHLKIYTLREQPYYP